MAKKISVAVKGSATKGTPTKWTCPGCEVEYVYVSFLFSDQGGAELCKDCLRENELLCRLGRIKKSPSES